MVKCPICNQEVADLTTHLRENPECLNKVMTVMETMVQWFASMFGQWWAEVQKAFIEFLNKVRIYLEEGIRT